jgi:hypothetical protein
MLFIRDGSRLVRTRELRGRGDVDERRRRKRMLAAEDPNRQERVEQHQRRIQNAIHGDFKREPSEHEQYGGAYEKSANFTQS